MIDDAETLWEPQCAPDNCRHDVAYDRVGGIYWCILCGETMPTPFSAEDAFGGPR